MGGATLTFPGGEVLLDEEALERPSTLPTDDRGNVGTSTSRTEPRGMGERRSSPPAEPSACPGAVASGDERVEAARAERRLLKAIRRGDERAFSRLVHAYQDRVYAICLRMLRRPDEAEEVAQDVFVALHRNLDSFRGDSRLSTWVYKVTRNHCLNRLKYLERRREDQRTDYDPSKIDRCAAPVAGEAAPAPDDHVEGLELQAVLEEALGDLSQEQRLLVILRDLHGLSYEEIMEISELPLGTVKSRLHRARLSLSAALRSWRGETVGGSGDRRTRHGCDGESG